MALSPLPVAAHFGDELGVSSARTFRGGHPVIKRADGACNHKRRSLVLLRTVSSRNGAMWRSVRRLSIPTANHQDRRRDSGVGDDWRRRGQHPVCGRMRGGSDGGAPPLGAHPESRRIVGGSDLNAEHPGNMTCLKLLQHLSFP